MVEKEEVPVGSARETLAAAKMEGVDLAQEAMELLLPRQFLRWSKLKARRRRAMVRLEG
jgi:hypothetical protein